MAETNPDPDITPGDFRIPTIDELDSLRVDHGLSQQELSRRAGMEESRFNHILHNDIDPHTSTLRAFLGVLQNTPKMDESDLSQKRGPKPKPSPLASGAVSAPESEEPVESEAGEGDEELSFREKVEQADPSDVGLTPTGERP